MKDKGHFLLFLLLLLVLQLTYAQNEAYLTFEYDNSGNQTIRNYCEGNCELQGNKIAEENSNVEQINTLAEQFDETVIMYPNPTTGVLKVYWDSNLRGEIEKIMLYDYQGRIISETKVAKLEGIFLNLSNRPTGIYLSKFIFADSSIHTRQIIKKD